MVFEPISFEEYEAAYLRVACLNEAGVAVVEYSFDPEASTGTTPASPCYEREFLDADRRWQLQNEAQSHAERRQRGS